jgi:predicted DNA-binding transcriptional regulator AlpA
MDNKREREHDVELSSEADTTGLRGSESSKLLLRAAEVGALMGASERWIWDKASAGKLPKPLRIGRFVRWRRRDIEAWIEAGCPDCSKAERLDTLHRRLKTRP